MSDSDDCSFHEASTSLSSETDANPSSFVVDCSLSVSSDYWKLYESGQLTDLSIQVGNELNIKIFLVHSLVLCARSKYFMNSLTGHAETSKEVQKTAVTFEDMMPDIFEVLLR